MRILRGYILGEFGKIFGLCLAALLGIYYIVDIFGFIEIFIDYDAPLVYKFSFFLYKLPMILYQVVPVALLVSIVTVIGIMSRNNELTAVKASGTNLYFLTLPLLLVSALLSLGVFANNEYILPTTNQRSEYILDVKVKGKPPRGIFRQSRIWYMGRDNTLYNVEVLDPRRGMLEGVSLVRFDDSFRLLERVDAQKAYPAGREWVLEDVVHRVFEAGGERLKQVERLSRMSLPLKETLEDFYKYKKDPDEMNYRELSDYINRLRTSGFDTTPYRVDLFSKTAIPLISLVVAFLSIAMAIRAGDRGGIVANIGLCLAVGVAYWLVLSIGISLGHAGRLGPFMAGWGANVIFGSAGLYLYANLKQ